MSEKVQSVESGIDFGIGVRLVFGTKVLYGYTNKTEAEELKRIASELAAKDLRDPATSSEPFDFIEVTDRHEASIPLSQDSSFDEKIAKLLSANQHAKNASNQISQTRDFVISDSSLLKYSTAKDCMHQTSETTQEQASARSQLTEVSSLQVPGMMVAYRLGVI